MVVLLLFVTMTYAFSTHYMSFIAQNSRSLHSLADLTQRESLFQKAENFIENHNKDTNSTFKVKHNRFSDWKEEELEKMRSSVKPLSEPLPGSKMVSKAIDRVFTNMPARAA